MIIPGSRIRDLREVAGWSTNDLARACNFRESYLLNIEAGIILKVNPFTYQKIADNLGVTLAQLNGDEEIEGFVSLEDEVPEEYRWLVHNTLRLIMILGTLFLVASMTTLAGLLLQAVRVL